MSIYSNPNDWSNISRWGQPRRNMSYIGETHDQSFDPLMTPVGPIYASSPIEPTSSEPALTREATFESMHTNELATQKKKYEKNIGDLTEEAREYYSRGRTAQIAGATLGFGSSLFQHSQVLKGRDGVRKANFQLDQQKRYIDINLDNQETLLQQGFANTIADLQVISAAKNVDLRSQAIKSQVVTGGEALGEDIRLGRKQAELDKAAIDMQKRINKKRQEQAERQSLFNTFVSGAQTAVMLL